MGEKIKAGDRWLQTSQTHLKYLNWLNKLLLVWISSLSTEHHLLQEHPNSYWYLLNHLHPMWDIQQWSLSIYLYSVWHAVLHPKWVFTPLNSAMTLQISAKWFLAHQVSFTVWAVDHFALQHYTSNFNKPLHLNNKIPVWLVSVQGPCGGLFSQL